MNELQNAILENFIAEGKAGVFDGWSRDMIVGYYLQFVGREATIEEVEQVINIAACWIAEVTDFRDNTTTTFGLTHEEAVEHINNVPAYKSAFITDGACIVTFPTKQMKEDF